MPLRALTVNINVSALPLRGVAKYPNLAASAQELFPMYSVPLFPNRSVWVGILWPLHSWARSMVLMLGAAGIGLQLSAAP